jgi:hypothetical protein
MKELLDSDRVNYLVWRFVVFFPIAACHPTEVELPIQPH